MINSEFLQDQCQTLGNVAALSRHHSNSAYTGEIDTCMLQLGKEVLKKYYWHSNQAPTNQLVQSAALLQNLGLGSPQELCSRLYLQLLLSNELDTDDREQLKLHSIKNRDSAKHFYLSIKSDNTRLYIDPWYQTIGALDTLMAKVPFRDNKHIEHNVECDTTSIASSQLNHLHIGELLTRVEEGLQIKLEQYLPGAQLVGMGRDILDPELACAYLWYKLLAKWRVSNIQTNELNNFTRQCLFGLQLITNTLLIENNLEPLLHEIPKPIALYLLANASYHHYRYQDAQGCLTELYTILDMYYGDMQRTSTGYQEIKALHRIVSLHIEPKLIPLSSQIQHKLDIINQRESG